MFKVWFVVLWFIAQASIVCGSSAGWTSGSEDGDSDGLNSSYSSGGSSSPILSQEDSSSEASDREDSNAAPSGNGASSSNASLDFSQFQFFSQHPGTYTLLSLDTVNAPFCSNKKDKEEEEEEQEDKSVPIGQEFISIQKFLSPSLLSDRSKVSLAQRKEDVDKENWLRLNRPPSTENCFVVRLYRVPPQEKSEILLEDILNPPQEQSDSEGGSSSEDEGPPQEKTYSHVASLLFFLQEEDPSKAMIYGFKQWRQVINMQTIVPQWGLHIVFSNRLFKDGTIKGGSAQKYRASNPLSHNERTAKLRNLKELRFEVGSDELQMIELLPKLGQEGQATHLWKAKDYLRFTKHIPKKKTKGQKSEKASKNASTKKSSSFQSLQGAIKFFRQKSDLVQEARLYLDAYVDDSELIEELQNELVEPKNRDFILPHRVIWSTMRELNISFQLVGHEETDTIQDILTQFSQLSDLLTCTSKNGKRSETYPIGARIYSLPMPYDDRFYRFDRGRWYEVDASRFQAIREILRKYTEAQEDLNLPKYRMKDARAGKDKVAQAGSSKQKPADYPADYQEKSYNEYAVDYLQKKGYEAKNFDRLNVPLASLGTKLKSGKDKTDVFEFCDIYFTDNKKQHYIIHVKRGRKELSKHLEQVHRTIRYFTDILDKRPAANLALQTLKRDLLAKYASNSKKNTSVGTYFRNQYKEQAKQKMDPQAFVDRILGVTQRKGTGVMSANNLRKKLQTLNQKKKKEIIGILSEIFKDHPDKCLEILDILALCHSNNPKLDIQEFLKEAEGFLASSDSEDLTRILKTLGTTPQKHRKTIHHVLAVIDDRAAKDILKQEKEKKEETKKADLYEPLYTQETVLFDNKDIWAIDGVRSLACEKGFNFKIVVINAQETPGWDVFGPLNSDSESENEEDSSEEKDLGKAKSQASSSPNASSRKENKKYRKTLNKKKDVNAESREERDLITKGKEQAEGQYKTKVGFNGVTNEIFIDDEGQEYLKVEIEADGDCCFYALGIGREETINKLKNYIDSCESSLAEAGQDRVSVGECFSKYSLLSTLLTTTRERAIEAFQGHDINSWAEQIIEYLNEKLTPHEKEQITQSFNTIIEQKSSLDTSSIDWNAVELSIKIVQDIFEQKYSSLLELHKYLEFEQAFVADIWKKIGENTLLDKLRCYLEKKEILNERGDILRDPQESDLNFTEQGDEEDKELANLSETQKKYIRYRLKFLVTSSEEKKEILDNFYIKDKNWLDPSAVMFLGPELGFKSKLYSVLWLDSLTSDNVLRSRVRLDSATPDAHELGGKRCRHIIYNGEDHYDLLCPIVVNS